MKFKSIRFEISFLYVGILGVILFVYGGLFYGAMRQRLYGGPGSYLDVLGPDRKALLLREMAFHILLGIPIVLLAVAFMGRLLARRIFMPLEKITQTLKNISSINLGTRVNVRGADEETKILADAFNAMMSRLEEAFKYISEFSSYAAHELKTPIAIIRGESEMALQKIQDAKEYKRVLNVNLEETERMLKTVEDLLLLTNLTYRSEVFKLEQFDFLEFLKEIHERCKMLASQKSITITMDLPAEPIKVSGNQLHLRRLFFNLLDNAIKFTPEQGKIGIMAKRKNGSVSVSISDTGIGIREEDLGKIFNRFYRAETPSQSSKPGSGLGLSIVQSIVKSNRGAIEVKSKLAKGSTFTVTLPLF